MKACKIVYNNNIKYMSKRVDWLMSGRASSHQNLVSIFPGMGNCLMVTKC